MKQILINKQGKALFPCDDFNVMSEGLICVQSNGLWGVMNEDGEIIIPFQFEGASHFKESLCAVKQNDKLGFINRVGTFIIEPQYEKGYHFENGCAKVMLSGKWGLINKVGKVLIPFTKGSPDSVEEPHDGLIRRHDDSSQYWWFIDTFGNVVINKFKCSWVDDFSDGLAEIRDGDGRTGYINTKGELVIPFMVGNGGRFHNKRAVFIVDQKYGVIDENGNFIVYPKYDLIYDYKNGYAVVWDRTTNKKGLLDTDGRLIIPFIMDPDSLTVASYSEGIMKVMESDRGICSFYDTKGKKLFEKSASFASQFKSGRCVICKDGLYGLIDKKGNDILPCQYKFIPGSFCLWHGCGEYFWVRCQDGKQIVVDKNGNKMLDLPSSSCLTPLIFSDNVNNRHVVLVKDVRNSTKGIYIKDVLLDIKTQKVLIEAFEIGEMCGGLFRVRKYNDKNHTTRYGYIDIMGRTVIPFKFSKALNFSDGFALVTPKKTSNYKPKGSTTKSDDDDGCGCGCFLLIGLLIFLFAIL